MQAVKDKLSEMNAMRKAKAEAKAEEQEQKELAKARVEIAKEVRKAKEAEAAMDLHVAKAGEKAEREIAKHAGVYGSDQENMKNAGADHNITGGTGGGAPPTGESVDPALTNNASIGNDHYPTSNKYI